MELPPERQIAKYGQGWILSRDGLINDDLGGFGQFPAQGGGAVRGTELRLVLGGVAWTTTLAWLGRGAWWWGPAGPMVAVALLAAWWFLCTRATILGRAEKGTGTICRNGPKGAPHKRGPSPFPAGTLPVTWP